MLEGLRAKEDRGLLAGLLERWRSVRGRKVLERENIAKEVDMDSREVVEVIAKEVDDERRRKQQQKKAAAAEQAQRSTGPVDRTCTTCTGSESGRPPG